MALLWGNPQTLDASTSSEVLCIKRTVSSENFVLYICALYCLYIKPWSKQACSTLETWETQTTWRYFPWLIRFVGVTGIYNGISFFFPFFSFFLFYLTFHSYFALHQYIPCVSIPDLCMLVMHSHASFIVSLTH